MKIGIIGAGNIGKAFAAHAFKAGYDIVISNSGDFDALEETAKSIGHTVMAGTAEEVLKADVIFLSVPFTSIKDVAGNFVWKDKVVIDATNAVTMPDMKAIDTNGKNSSEVVSEILKGAKIIKAFNTIPAALMAANPKLENGNRVLFYSGNDADSKKIVTQIIEDFGFAGLDLGTLGEGGKLQELIIGSLSLQNLIKIPLQ